MAAFLPFSFFLAYGIMSIPAGIMIEKIGEKKSMLIAFSLNLIGALSFAFHPTYTIALSSLFVIGIGMAMLQVIINPLMRTAGGEENFAFYSVMAQMIFGLASFVSPFVFSYMIKSLNGGIANIITDNLRDLVGNNAYWTSLYWLFSLIFVIMVILLTIIKIPVVKLNDDEKSGTFKTYLNLLKQKEVWLFFLGIVAYVGTEQSLANWMSEFLRAYHNVDPSTVGANTIALFWGLMTVGCLLGLLILKIWDSKKVLKSACILSVLILFVALFGNTQMALWAFPAAGFTISVMFSIIFSLALNSVTKNHGSFSGILCSGIFGGALVPLIVGNLGDFIGLKYALLFLFLTLGYILFLSFTAQPIVANKTIKLKDLFKTL